MLAAELHTHSARSHDGRDPVERLLEQARSVGLDALAVTDHDTIDASLEAVEAAGEYGLIGIPGTEVTSDAGHVLALGVRERIDAGLSFDETLDRIREAGGIAILPHPFQKSRSGVGPNVQAASLARADAIEVYNSRLLTGRGNRRARAFAEKHDLPMTAGSDAHVAAMVGRAVTHLDVEAESVGGIVDAIRAGRTTIGGRRTPWRVSFRQAAGGAKRRAIGRLRDLL
ncbi:MAG: CehA/McbA family metallohydrolase [Halobacteriales archaeon]